MQLIESASLLGIYLAEETFLHVLLLGSSTIQLEAAQIEKRERKGEKERDRERGETDGEGGGVYGLWILYI